MAILDDMFIDSEVDVDKWSRENDAKQTSKSGFLPSYRLKDKKPDNIGLVSFLNEGLMLQIHSVRYFEGGKERYADLLCLGKECPLCKKKPATKQAAYMLIDWLHSYTKDDEVFAYPKVKLMLKGLNTAKIIASRREKYGSLLGKKWEIRRMGTGFHTYYDILLEEQNVAPDLTATKTLESEQGARETLVISRPTEWPEYLEGSFYANHKLKPEGAPNFADPEQVKTFIKCYMLNESPLLYERGAAGVPTTGMGKSAPKQPSETPTSNPAPAKSGAAAADRDLPF